MRPPSKSDILDPVLPNAISIGGQRCASTYLERVLADIPGVFWIGEQDALGRVLAFEGIEGVSRVFARGRGCRIIGEKTPTYSAMYACEVRQIARLVPKVKIIFTLRNPIDRCWSSATRYWSFSHLDGQPPGPQTDRQILAFLDGGLSRRLTDYVRTLRIWSASFPREQILINTVDQLNRDPDEFSRQILDFLEIPIPPTISTLRGKRINSSKEIRQLEPYHQYLLARRWLPMLRELQSMLPELDDIPSWRESLELIVRNGDPNWGVQGAALLAFHDAIHGMLYRPVSIGRAKWRAESMRRAVNRHRPTAGPISQ